MTSGESVRRPTVALIPAAGRATRLGALPCSKEIYPVAFRPDSEGVPRPAPVCAPMLESMAEAGIERAIWLLRRGKWDVADRLGDGSRWGLDLAYLAVEETTCVPETLSRAMAWIEGCDVALGFPDILLRPSNVWSRLMSFHRAHGDAVSLGLFPTDQAWKADMVEVDHSGRVTGIVIKDPDCTLSWTWSIALWRPPMTRRLMDWVQELRRQRRSDPDPPVAGEAYIGDVIRRGIEDGLTARALRFDDGDFLDIGTPDDLRRAVSRGARGEEER